jgi:hypothetical protein|tara:strand:- start:14378 stop:15010 length:633 start_codon:yes stop_codon:yes gene_type:complete
MDRKLKIGQYYIVTKDFSDKYNSFYEGDLLEILDEKDYNKTSDNIFSRLFKKKKDRKIGLVAYYKSSGAGGIHINIDDENVILDNVVLEDSTYLKWKSIGFTDGLTRELGIKLSHAYENTANILLADTGDNKIYNKQLDIYSFPVLKKYLTLNPNINVTDEFIMDFLFELNEYVEVNKEILQNITMEVNLDDDIQAKLLLKFCEKIYNGR